MVVFTLAVLWTLTAAHPEPDRRTRRSRPPTSRWFPWFLGFFLCVFAATGIGNGSTYKMIPAIWRTRGRARHDAGHAGARRRAAGGDQAGLAAIGVIGAVGAIGGFLIPMAFSSPWVDDPMSATKGAFVVFTGVLRRLRAR